MSLLAIPFALGWLGETVSRAQPVPPSEQQVKAAILVNLPKYVEWPSRAFAASNSPIVLDVFAPAELEAELRKMIAGKAVEGHPLELRRFEPDAVMQPAPQLLFISGMERKQAAETLRRYRGQPVLTVQDEGNAVEEGTITLLRKDKKVRLGINLEAAKESGLTISSKLLGVADVTKGKAK